jgi:protein gp37
MDFVNFMSDLFHPDVPEDFIRRVFEMMKQARMHTFQVLTKRSERLAAIGENLSCPSNAFSNVFLVQMFERDSKWGPERATKIHISVYPGSIPIIIFIYSDPARK